MTNLVDAFCKVRVLVTGDVMLDRYAQGEAHRISPEAPVPVVRVRRTWGTPGGACPCGQLPGGARLSGDRGRPDHPGTELRAALVDCGAR